MSNTVFMPEKLWKDIREVEVEADDKIIKC